MQPRAVVDSHRVLLALGATLVASSALVAQDINGNAVRDAIDLRSGTSEDCDRNGVPDEADLNRPSFSAAVEHSNDSATLTNVNAVLPIDFDADGDLDLVVAARSGSSNSTLSLWRNEGGPGFRFASRLTVTNALCFALRAGDLNGDGRPDIIASDAGFPNVIVALANASGGFSAATKLAASSRSTGIVVVDLDADGDLDIASAAFASNGVDVLRNNGNGTFAPKVLYACGQQPSAVAAGDVDGDGLLDLAVANSFVSWPGNGTITLLRNAGGALFTTLATVTVPTGGAGALPDPTDVALADVDGDRDRDLLVSSTGSNDLTVFANDGSGVFSVEQSLGPLPSIASTAGRFLATNLDADDAVELAWADPAARVIHLYDNAAGTFVHVRSYAAGTEGPVGIAAADLDGDGLVDLISANDSISSFSVLRGLGAFRLDAVEHIRRSDSNYTPILADFTGDGVVDLASYATSDTPTTFRVAPGLGDGSFGPAIISSLPSPAPLLPRDANGDGHLDIVGVGNGGNRYCCLNNGDGTFGAPIFSSPFSQTGGFQTADINGDGHLDALWVFSTASNQPHKIRISLGDGTGFFAPFYEFETPPFLGTGSGDVWTGDLTGDGAPEIFASVAPGIVSPVGQETVLVYENDGSGGFGPFTVHAYDLLPNFSAGVGNFAWVDIDGDGDNDLLGASGSTWLFRNEGGTLAAPVAVAAIANYGRNELGPTILDADGDGDLDFYGTAAVGSIASPTIFFNDGTGLFPIRSSVARYRNAADATAVGDVDGDARPDIVVRPQGQTDWYLHRVQPSEVADCDGNGVADACDIASGTLPDANGNGIPDGCEPPTPIGDLDGDGGVGGSDLAILLGAWGSFGGAADLNGDGIVDAADLALLLGAWG